MDNLSALIARVFSTVCKDNGVLTLGLATTEETGVTLIKRIPVPSNVNRHVNHHALIRIAAWSAQKYREANAIDGWTPETVMVYAVWVYGLVCSKEVVPTDAGYDTLGLVDWDTEVTVLNEAVPDLKKPITEEELPHFLVPADAQKNLGTILTWIIASKITWRIQGHHLGARDMKATSETAVAGKGFSKK